MAGESELAGDVWGTSGGCAKGKHLNLHLKPSTPKSRVLCSQHIRNRFCCTTAATELLSPYRPSHVESSCIGFSSILDSAGFGRNEIEGDALMLTGLQTLGILKAESAEQLRFLNQVRKPKPLTFWLSPFRIFLTVVTDRRKTRDEGLRLLEPTFTFGRLYTWTCFEVLDLLQVCPRRPSTWECASR